MILATAAEISKLGRLVVNGLLAKAPATALAVAAHDPQKTAGFAARGVSVRGADYMPLSVPCMLFVLFALPVANGAYAQEPPMELHRLSAPIIVDGRPDEPAWQDVPALPLTMYTPIFRGQPTQHTEIRVAYDDEYLYAAGWFYDTDSKGIRNNSLYRDRYSGDDTFAIFVDAFNDNQNAKWFTTTPSGTRLDRLLSDDANTQNDNWDGFWTSVTTVTDEGWFVEVQIPFSTLGFSVGEDGRAVMGLSITRLVARNNERVTFPAVDPKFPFRRPSLMQDVVLRGVRTRRPLYVTPYVLGSSSRTHVTAGGGALRRERQNARDLGLDVRYQLSGTLTFDFTANTDFAQVEADDQQVALDRFPLFYPERRRFFQEGSTLFDFTGAHGVRLFHSRRIGLTRTGTPLPILGGVRLVGKAAGWEIGGIEMQTNSEGAVSGENFGVLRLRRPVFNQASTAGLMITTYHGGGRYNLAVGADTSLRLFGDEYVGLKWAATVDERDPDAVGVASRSFVDASWARRTERGLSYTGQFTRAGLDYRPELGFMPRRNFTAANLVSNWYFFTDSHKYFRRVWPGMQALSTFRNADGALESGLYAVSLQWETKSGGTGRIEPKLFHENVLLPFTIGNKVLIPAGRYDFSELQVVNTMPMGRKIRTDLDFRIGPYFDGQRTHILITPTWNLNKHLELGGDYQLNALRFGEREQDANVHLVRLRIRTALDTRASGNALLQYNSTTERIDLNLRLRYNFAEGTDLWIVYNEGLDTTRDRDLLQENRSTPLSLSRELVLKYTHTFEL